VPDWPFETLSYVIVLAAESIEMVTKSPTEAVPLYDRADATVEFAAAGAWEVEVSAWQPEKTRIGTSQTNPNMKREKHFFDFVVIRCLLETN
jgi:hypothetical protein